MWPRCSTCNIQLNTTVNKKEKLEVFSNSSTHSVETVEIFVFSEENVTLEKVLIVGVNASTNSRISANPVTIVYIQHSPNQIACSVSQVPQCIQCSSCLFLKNTYNIQSIAYSLIVSCVTSCSILDLTI